MDITGAQVRSAALGELLRGQLARPEHPKECLESVRCELLGLLRQTRDVLDSTSIVVVGHEGAGKTALLEGALTTLRSEAERDEATRPIAIVRLDGRIHTSDKSALKAATRQLSEQLLAIEAAADVRRRAAAAAVALSAGGSVTSGSFEARRTKKIERNKEKLRQLSEGALPLPTGLAAQPCTPTAPVPRSPGAPSLGAMRANAAPSARSHPKQRSTTAGRGVRMGDTIAHERFLRTTLEQCGVPTIIVLDAFELFTERPKQTMLYNLFTLATQGGVRLDDAGVAADGGASRLALAVVGLSRRSDAVQALEKRVNSRFAHHQLLVTLPRWPTLVAMMRDALLAPCRAYWASASAKGRATLVRYAASVHDALGFVAATERGASAAACAASRERVAAARRALLELRRAYNTGRSLRWCFHAIAAAVYRITDRTIALRAEWIQDAICEQALLTGEAAVHDSLRCVVARGGTPLVLLVALAVHEKARLIAEAGVGARNRHLLRARADAADVGMGQLDSATRSAKRGRGWGFNFEMAIDTVASAPVASVRTLSRQQLLCAFQQLTRLSLVVAVGGGVRIAGTKRGRSADADGAPFLGDGGGGRGTWDDVQTFEGVRLAFLPEDLHALVKRTHGMEEVATDVQHWAQNVLSG